MSPAVLLGGVRLTALIWACTSGGTVCDPGFTVVVVVGGGCVGGGCVGGGGFGWVGGGFGTVVVGCGRVDGGRVVEGDVCGGAVVVVGGPTIWARACQTAAAPKAVVASTTIPAARQRELTPSLFSSPALFACCVTRTAV